MILVTVADDRSGRKDGKYGETQDYIQRLFSAHPEFGITDFLMWKWDDIRNSRYYTEYKDQLDLVDAEQSGRLYKPLLIKEGLSRIGDGEFLVYNDTSVELWRGLDSLNWNRYSAEVMKRLCVENGGILTALAEFNYDSVSGYVGIGHPRGVHNYDVPGYHTQEIFSSVQCRKVMDPEDNYAHCMQHASGFIVLRKDEKSVKFIEDWIYYNTIPECHKAVPNEAHRTDQSISGLLINRLGNRLVYCIQGQHQHLVINPYNLLSFSQFGTDYHFLDSIQPKQEKTIALVPILEHHPDPMHVWRWRVIER